MDPRRLPRSGVPRLRRGSHDAGCRSMPRVHARGRAGRGGWHLLKRRRRTAAGIHRLQARATARRLRCSPGAVLLGLDSLRSSSGGRAEPPDGGRLRVISRRMADARVRQPGARPDRHEPLRQLSRRTRRRLRASRHKRPSVLPSRQAVSPARNGSHPARLCRQYAPVRGCQRSTAVRARRRPARTPAPGPSVRSVRVSADGGGSLPGVR